MVTRCGFGDGTRKKSRGKANGYEGRHKAASLTAVSRVSVSQRVRYRIALMSQQVLLYWRDVVVYRT
jgi:hypothetical protein